MFRDVRAWMLNASGMTLADLHALITFKLQIELTIPPYVVQHPVHISYSVCRYYSDNVGAGWLKPTRSCIRVTAGIGVTKMHACS